MSAFAPTSMPRVGSSRMISSGAVASQRARSTFCWLPPERVLTTASGLAGLTSERLDVLGDHGVALGPAELAHPATAGLDAQHDVLGDREVGDDALAATVLRGEHDPMLDGVARRADPRGLAVDGDGSGVGAIGAVEQAGELGAARAQQAGQARRPRRRTPRGRPARAPRGVPRPCASRTGTPDPVDLAVRGCGDRLQVVELAADHLGDEVLARQVLDQVLAHQPAVAQHGHAVGDLVHLVEEVADEQDRHARGRSSRMTAKSCSTSPRSRLDVGSSRISTRESRTIARLIATSCWMASEWLDSDRAGVDLQAEALQVLARPARARPSSRSGRRGAARGPASRSPRPTGSGRGSPPGTRWRCLRPGRRRWCGRRRGAPATVIVAGSRWRRRRSAP